MTKIRKQLFFSAIISIAVIISAGFSPASAALNITKTHTGDFTQGQTGAIYTITVANVGPGATIGAVTVTDNLPFGLFASAMSGTGWSCNLGTRSCTRSDVLAPGGSYPAITLTVDIADMWPVNMVPASVTNTATVSGGGSVNNTASDEATLHRKQQQSAVATVPTITEWGILLFTCLAGIGAVYHLKRRR